MEPDAPPGTEPGTRSGSGPDPRSGAGPGGPPAAVPRKPPGTAPDVSRDRHREASQDAPPGLPPAGPRPPAVPAGPPFAPALHGCRAVVFDTDGVLLDSTGLHAAAWQGAFDACVKTHDPAQPPFDPGAEYRELVDGRPRLDGAAAFLRARGLRLPPGGPDDPPGTGTVAAVAARKEQLFTALLRTSRVTALPGAARLVAALRGAGVPRAAVSASRHATELLEHAGLHEGLFQAVVDGREAARLGLPGKPDPALFLEAARRLGAEPSATAVVEDARAGVRAGHRGGFRPVIGVDRTATADGAARLLEHGADMVVGDLADLLTGPPPGRPAEGARA